MKMKYAPLKTRGALLAFYRKYILNKGNADRYAFLYKRAGLGHPEGDKWMEWCRVKYCEEMREDRFMGMVKILSARCQHHRFWKGNSVASPISSRQLAHRYSVARRKAVACGFYEDLRKQWDESRPKRNSNTGLGIQFLHLMESWVRDFEVYMEHDGFLREVQLEIDKLQKVEEVELDDFTSAFWMDATMSEGMKICYENYRKGLGRKQSRRAYYLLMDIYKRYYGDRLVSQDARRRHSQRRRNLKSAKKDSKVKTKILAINAGPCKCYWCGISLPQGGHADHIVPLSKGGSHTCDNIVAACKQCNETKKDIMPNSKDLPIHMELQLPLIHN